MIGVPVICAETTDEARWLSGSSALSFVRLRQSRPTPLPTPEDAAEYVFTPMERETVRPWTATPVCGDPETVRTELEALAERTGADELMLTTMVHSSAARLRSYELVAEAWNRAPLSESAPATPS